MAGEQNRVDLMYANTRPGVTQTWMNGACVVPKLVQRSFELTTCTLMFATFGLKEAHPPTPSECGTLQM